MNSEMRALITEMLHNKRNRDILSMYFIDGCTYEKIAERVDLTPRQVGSIISRGKRELAPIMERVGAYVWELRR